MDKQNRLTKNEEWQVGARYRRAERQSKLMRSVSQPEEVTFLGWADGGRLRGFADLRSADGKVVTQPPNCWKGRYVRVAEGEAPPSTPLPDVTQDWPRTTASIAPDDVREWVHEVPPRYYLHQPKTGEGAGKWVVIDRVYDLADGRPYRRKADCVRAFVRTHDKRSSE